MSKFLKRTLDIGIAVFGILLTLPVFPFIALLIKLDSRGPIFYLCDRIGKDGKSFRMFKFRSMIETPVRVGVSVSPQGDVRVTNFGRILRRTKLNELPQLVNILKGDMSFVGPRPEAPDLADLYPPEARKLFSVKPGLVGPNQILNRNEEELYPAGADPKDYYINHILPQKLKIDLEYVNQPTIFADLKYILLAVKETVLGAISRRHFFENQSQIYLFLFDMAFVFGCYLFAVELRFEGEIPEEEWHMLINAFPILLFYRIGCFIGFGLYGVLIRYMNLQSYVAVAKAVTVSTLLSALTVYGIGYHSFSRSLWIIDWFCLIAFMLSIRVPGKLLRNRMYGKKENGKKKVLIFGAGDKGNLAAVQLRERVNIIGFLDDDRSKRNKRIQECKVMGNRYDIKPLSNIYPIDEVIIAISDLDERNLNHIIDLCHKASVRYSIFTTLVDSFTDRMKEEYVRNKKIFNWIGGEELQVDLARLEDTFSGKRLMVIGPSNMLGMKLLNYLSYLNTGEIVLLDRYEAYLNETLQRALAFFPKHKVKPILSSDPLPVAAERIFSSENSPSIIIHMGTRKYPSYMQVDPLLPAKDNILNTWDLLQAGKHAGCELFLMISSVSAADPIDLIPATLRLAEYYLQSIYTDSSLLTAIVRLYNLLENRGSVLRIIQEQLKDAGKIILNHPEEKGYFISAASAAKLILLAASMTIENRKGGPGIFVPSFNGQVKVLDIAKLIIQDYGIDPNRDVEIEYVGADNSEKWREIIHPDGHEIQDTAHHNVKRIVPAVVLSQGRVKKDIEEFRELLENKDSEGVARKVEEALKLITHGL